VAKILWYGDACSNTGFGRVTHSVLAHLSKEHEVAVIGINYNGDPHEYDYKIYPASNLHCADRFGLPRLVEIFNKEKPDVFICLNDIWVVNQVWERIHFLKEKNNFKFVAYFPTDSERYPNEMLRHIPHWDLAITFTVQQANRILSHGISPSRMGVLPHGVDLSKFNPMPREEARKALSLPLDKFIVLNANRNQPRKQIDLTIKAFAEFAQDKPDTMLYLHMGAKDMGWEIIPLFEREMKLRGLDPTNRLVLTSTDINYIAAPPDELLNKIYNAADVGLNTTNGEGWGLVAFEHAACRKPQVQPCHTSCMDLWDGAGMLIDVATWIIDKDLSVERGLINTSHAANLLSQLYADKALYAEVADACFAVTQRPEYRWESVAAGFSQAVVDLTK
jgi:glycosyltransferase involved in cell wall biosynthesis